ncbi:MAG TPA: hypothetical protein VEC18_11875, partial [Myxococcota bacterium]|nr:hypothetical protein [Myxococcota bacterium]
MRERRLRALDDTARDRATQPANRASPSARGANGWTGGQYSAVRFAIGACLLAQFLVVLGSGSEPWGGHGVARASDPLAPAAGASAFPITDARALIAVLSLAGAALSALLALGVRDRAAALLLSCVVCGLVALAAPTIGAGAVAIAILLLLQAWLPRAPYGSWDARGRVDPGGDWRMPTSVHAACWCALAIGYALSGAATLAGAAWGDGGSLAGLLASAPAHDSPLRGLGLAHPQHAFSVTAWGVAALQIGFAALALFPRVRPWLWLAFFGAQIARLAL